MVDVADVFVACDRAVGRDVPLRPPDPTEAGLPFQNWFEDRVRDAGVPLTSFGSRRFPDFVLDDADLGFELKGLEIPGRDRSFDANSQLPKGQHEGREIFYVFGRYPKRTLAAGRVGLLDLAIVHGDVLSLPGQPIHKNTSVRGAGSYGDFLIRVRKMYVPPTPYAILDGIAGQRTLVVPERMASGLDNDERLIDVGTFVRRETAEVIVGIDVDLLGTAMAPRTSPNPSAHRAHSFTAYRTAQGSPSPVSLSARTPSVVDGGQEEDLG